MGIVRKQGITNTAVVLIGTAIGAASLLLIQPHYLTKEELGLTRLILSFATVLSSLLSFGISSVTVRYMPRVFDRTTGHRGFFGFMLLYTSVSVGVGLSFLVLLREQLGAAYGGDGDLFGAHFRFVVLLSVAISFVLGLNAYCMALLRSVFPTVLNDIIVRILFIAVILAHYAGWLGRDPFLLGFCLIYVVQAVLLALYVLIVDRPSLVPDIAHIRQAIGLRSIMRYGAIITFTSINSVSLKYLDSIFVGRISTEEVAVYSIAAFIGLIIEIPLTALERIANPAIAHAMAKHDLVQVRTIYHRSARFLLLLGGLSFVLVVANVTDVLGLLPEGYRNGAQVSMVIALGALINMATGINYPILVNSDRYIYGSVFLVILLIVTVIGNWLLIPIMGMMGAAVTACGASIVYNGLKFEFIRRRFGMQPFDRTTLSIVVVVLLLAASALAAPLPWDALLNIAVRTVLCTFAFLMLVRQLNLASDALDQMPSILRRLVERSPERS